MNVLTFIALLQFAVALGMWRHDAGVSILFGAVGALLLHLSRTANSPRTPHKKQKRGVRRG